MGTAEIQNGQLIIQSNIITYGTAADPAVTENIRDEIETMWNEPQATVILKRQALHVVFHISATCKPQITPEEIFENTNPQNNYFRIEPLAMGNISFVDGLGCNSGYFKLENLYKGSTTAAHEYGHTIGLGHPTGLDLRGKGVPGIMYPRGTLVDPQFQYNPHAAAGNSSQGGTMHPMHRKVKLEDIDLLKLHKLYFQNGISILGEFSSVWHPNHADMSSPGSHIA
ncbi:zinc metalloprotease [Agriterribacter humi]|uniref:peptidase M10 n=1 Tax=Agriterribacter humi TaxID=1104781 RepID=UPI001264449F|nr:peptidase M10 [Agriterribacter humi]